MTFSGNDSLPLFAACGLASGQLKLSTAIHIVRILLHSVQRMDSSVPQRPKQGIEFCGSLLVLLVAFSLGASGQTSSPPADQRKAPYDTSSWFSLLMAAEAGGGFDGKNPYRPTAYAGAKFGIPGIQFGSFDPAKPDHTHTFTLDVGYEHLRTHRGGSAEISAMLPIFRFPKPQPDETKNFLRIYAEPGLGYSWGRGLGGYGSAKVMIALLSDSRLDFSKVSPFVEIQHRFPFAAPLQGDTRVAFGFMIALCNHCGLD